jgi:hypothetical protein
MHKITLLVALAFILSPQISSANHPSDALANAGDACNSIAYDVLKPQRKKPGARDLMDLSSKGKKYAKWMKKYLKLIATCKSEPYLPDCKPASKIDTYKTKLIESEEKLEANMIKNYLCSSPYVNQLAGDGSSHAQIKPTVENKINGMLGAAAR